MLEVFNRRNTVILALMQVGVIVIGFLAARQNLRILEDMLEGQGLPFITVVMGTVGGWFLLVPLAWITAISYCDYRKDTSRDLRILTLIAGIVLFLVFIILFVWALVAPYLKVTWGIDADSPPN